MFVVYTKNCFCRNGKSVIKKRDIKQVWWFLYVSQSGVFNPFFVLNTYLDFLLLPILSQPLSKVKDDILWENEVKCYLLV